jgi:pyruvate,water dikinase
MKHIKLFKGLTKNDAHIAGGKGASLGEMTNAGIPVPGGFVVTSESFEFFLAENDLTTAIEAILKKVNHKEMESVERASEQIKELVLSAKMPKEMQKEIKTNFLKLKAKFVAVRSSATAEDGAEHAWAGQLDSFLNTTSKNLEENVKRCFASLFTPRAIFYRFEKGLNKSHISVAVVVQKMVQSEKSGIAFSVHPVTEDRNQMIIEGSWGLGEAIVSGQITPDSYVIEKDTNTIIDINIAEKSKGLFRNQKGPNLTDGHSTNIWKNIATKKSNEQCLSGKEILKLGEIIKRIEKHYGFPCDIEWAYEKKKFYIVQSRPITTLNK